MMRWPAAIRMVAKIEHRWRSVRSAEMLMIPRKSASDDQQMTCPGSAVRQIRKMQSQLGDNLGQRGFCRASQFEGVNTASLHSAKIKKTLDEECPTSVSLFYYEPD